MISRRYLTFERCEAMALLPSMADAVWSYYKRPVLVYKTGFYYTKHRAKIISSFKYHHIPLPTCWRILDHALPAPAPALNYNTSRSIVLDAKRTAALPYTNGQWPVVR